MRYFPVPVGDVVMPVAVKVNDPVCAVMSTPFVWTAVALRLISEPSPAMRIRSVAAVPIDSVDDELKAVCGPVGPPPISPPGVYVDDVV